MVFTADAPILILTSHGHLFFVRTHHALAKISEYKDSVLSLVLSPALGAFGLLPTVSCVADAWSGDSFTASARVRELQGSYHLDYFC